MTRLSRPWWIYLLAHYAEQHRQSSLLPAISLFMLPSMFTHSVNIVLIIVRSSRYAWKTSSVLFFAEPQLLTLFTCCNKHGSGCMGKPSLVTVCHIVSDMCHWKNKTTHSTFANVPLYDTAFEVEISATSHSLHLQGALPHGSRLKQKKKPREWSLCERLGRGLFWDLAPLMCRCSAANCSVTSGNTALSFRGVKEMLHFY